MGVLSVLSLCISYSQGYTRRPRLAAHSIVLALIRANSFMAMKETGLDVTFWGIRGSTPVPGPQTARYGGNTPCVEVRAGDAILLMLAPESKVWSGPSKRTLMDRLNSICFSRIPTGTTFRVTVFSARLRSAKRNKHYWSQESGLSLVDCLERQMLAPNFPVPFALQGVKSVSEMASGESRAFGGATVHAHSLIIRTRVWDFVLNMAAVPLPTA